MIGFLRGRLISKNMPALLLDVQGVGYEVETAVSTFERLPETGNEIQLFTHLSVREDAHTLYGFTRESDRALFRLLIKVNGVGAKLALAILSAISADDFQRCVQSQDTAALVRIPGVGKKTAERLIIEMRDRFAQTLSDSVGVVPDQVVVAMPSNPLQEAVSALQALGYKPQEAERMLKAVSKQAETSEELIRLALRGAARG